MNWVSNQKPNPKPEKTHRIYAQTFSQNIIPNMANETKENPSINQTKNNMIRLGVCVCERIQRTMCITQYKQNIKLLN